MFISFLFLCSIHLVISLSNQEDLAITNYTQIGCLILKSDKQYLVNNIQENSLLSYQTFSSTHMNVELCFRLCRRRIILLSNNQTNCICLYTIDKPYELNEYLGEFLTKKYCQTNSTQIYSLNDNAYILPPLTKPTTDDWSVDGCYYLHGIQTVDAHLRLDNVNYTQAIDLCRKHCRTPNEYDHYSFYLSRKNFCYCAPLNFSQITETIALRTPFKHCSFLPYICDGYSGTCEDIYTNTNRDTLIKIDVQQYCSSTTYPSFIFDRIFYMCFKTVLLSRQMTFSNIISTAKCLPLVIKTLEQWNYLNQSTWITSSKTFIPIDKNSNHILKYLFQSNNLISSENNLCLVIYRRSFNQIAYELIQCTNVHAPGYVFCAQKPVQSVISHEQDFHPINNETQISSDEILSCPSEFVLFNNICYYVHSSFVNNTLISERLCNNNYPTSALVKFSSHNWGNINASKFLGRTFDDILLEFFYYILEKKLSNNTTNQSSKKDWLRLLVGDKYNSTECSIRYFARTTGGFTTLYQCNDGGHPICRIEPIRTKISHINHSTTTTTTSTIVSSSTTTLSSTIILNSTSTTICENCTPNPPIADKDLIDNDTKIDLDFLNNTIVDITNEPNKKKSSSYSPLLLIISGPVLALIILFLGIGLLVRHLRQNHGSYSTHSSIAGSRRTKRSSTILTASDIPNTPAVLYTRLKTTRASLTDTDMLLPLDNSLPPIDDTIEMLPATKTEIINADENPTKTEDTEPLYAILK